MTGSAPIFIPPRDQLPPDAAAARLVRPGVLRLTEGEPPDAGRLDALAFGRREQDTGAGVRYWPTIWPDGRITYQYPPSTSWP
jgi:hypothetical protein